jgi:hypothetical protein
MSIEKALQTFGKRVQQQSRSNLTRLKKNVSGDLYKGTKYDLTVSPNSFSLSFPMTPYWNFQDQGVSGTERKFNTPFSYKETSKVLGLEYNTGTFAKWARQKGIKPRDKKTGKFITFKSFGLAVAINKKKFGIKPSKFFSTPFENEFNKLPDELVQAYSLELDDLLRFTTR